MNKKVYALMLVESCSITSAYHTLMGIFDNPKKLIKIAKEDLKNRDGTYYLEIWEYELNKKIFWGLRDWELIEFIKEFGDKNE